ncbi:hypothetical protein CP10139811_0519 [Chlamydia ibidis]|uniref:Uncharacterized protein n=2 Tax=Chlamydia ibidis TaxID=1405396 RepID=S7KKB5_9CHLA|nr:hypothetical protein [Chlamydia ibidis]EPP34875.1 hypothetical protein CP10139811_0519 [Chlamydia ibidis]
MLTKVIYFDITREMYTCDFLHSKIRLISNVVALVTSAVAMVLLFLELMIYSSLLGPFSYCLLSTCVLSLILMSIVNLLQHGRVGYLEGLVMNPPRSMMMVSDCTSRVDSSTDCPITTSGESTIVSAPAIDIQRDLQEELCKSNEEIVRLRSVLESYEEANEFSVQNMNRMAFVKKLEKNAREHIKLEKRRAERLSRVGYLNTELSDKIESTLNKIDSCVDSHQVYLMESEVLDFLILTNNLRVERLNKLRIDDPLLRKQAKSLYEDKARDFTILDIHNLEDQILESGEELVFSLREELIHANTKITELTEEIERLSEDTESTLKDVDSISMDDV